MEQEFLQAAAGSIGAILALASLLGGLFGRGKGDSDSEDVSSEIPPEVLQQLLAGLGIDTRSGLRSSLLTDPGLAGSFNPQQLADLGLDPLQLQSLLQGSVPLRPAVNNLAFGLLPRWARSQNPQDALLAASPQNRINRFGSAQPFNNALDIGSFGLPQQTDVSKSTLIQACNQAGGVPVLEGGRYVRCDFPTSDRSGFGAEE